ncbi:DUF4097 family beta strand repeat protein [candidate division WOR-3 bacterium]|nr:DUF4097 family beta strand repeat protein [candidate division WOR-3 bacterium]
MSNERDRILRLLEDGKISADQATRLIEALGSERTESEFGMPHTHFGPRRHFRVRTRPRDLDRIPDVVATAVASAMKNGFGEPGEERTNEFPGKRDLLVKSVSGDVEVTRAEEGRVELSYSGGMVKARSSGDQVVVRTMAGDVAAAMPPDGRLELEVVSGDVSVSQGSARVEVKTVSGDVGINQASGGAQVKTVSGDVNLADVSGDLTIETRSGDVELVPGGPVTGNLRTVSGDVTVALPKDADLVLEMDIEEDGEIEVDDDLPHEVLEESEDHLKVKLGAGSQTLVVKTRDGDISIRAAEEDRPEEQM